MKKILFFIVLLFVNFSLVGCSETKLLERVGLTTLIGYDLGNGDEVVTTAIVHQVGTELESKVAIISAENKTSEGTRSKINRKAAQKIMSGQLRIILFGEELAKEGIGHYIDTLLKDPTISDGIFLSVVKGETKPLLEFEYSDIDDIGDHIYKMLKQNIDNEQVVSSTLHEVAHDYYTAGRNIAIPIIKKENELVEISGIALFKKGKMIGELSIDDSFYVKLGRDNYRNGKFETKIKGDELPSSLIKNPSDGISVVFDPIKARKKVKLVNPKKPEFDLHITIQSRILEIKPDVNVGDAKKAKKLEKAISKRLESEISRVIAYCQEIDSDVFGFGEYYRSSVRNSKLTEEKWHELYREMKVNVDVDFTLIRSGVFE